MRTAGATFGPEPAGKREQREGAMGATLGLLTIAKIRTLVIAFTDTGIVHCWNSISGGLETEMMKTANRRDPNAFQSSIPPAR
jgi:hypothetical protein